MSGARWDDVFAPHVELMADEAGYAVELVTIDQKGKTRRTCLARVLSSRNDRDDAFALARTWAFRLLDELDREHAARVPPREGLRRS